MANISFPTSIGGVNISGLTSNPLGALLSDPFELDITKYPRDLGASTRTHFLKFDIYDVTPTTLGDIAGPSFGTGDITSQIESATNWLGGLIGDFTTQNTDNTAMQGFNPSRLDFKESIALYIPDTVNFSYDANYGEISLGGQDSALTKLPGVIGGAAKLVAGALSSDPGRLFLRSQGLALNPNQQVMFDGINLRTFAFEFNFMPKSAEEAKDVKKIINKFKLYSRPRTMKDTFGMVFVPPSIFKIQFKFLNTDNHWVNKIADSVITNIEVDYAPNGWATHQDGSPVNTKLKLEFKELSLIDRDGDTTSVTRGY